MKKPTTSSFNVGKDGVVICFHPLSIHVYSNVNVYNGKIQPNKINFTWKQSSVLGVML